MKIFIFITIFFNLIISCSHNFSKNEYKGFGKDSLTEQQIEKYLPGKLKNHQIQYIQKMLDVRTPGSGVISPDGQNLYFGWSVTGIRHVWKINGPKKFPTQMTGGGTSTYIITISPNGKFLILSKDKNGKEMPGLYIQDVNGGPLKEIFYKEGIQTSFQWVSTDSKYIYYRTNEHGPTTHTFYKHSIETGKRKILLKKKGYWFFADTRKKDDMILLGLAKGSRAREYFLFNPKIKKMTPVIGQGENQKYSISFGCKKDEYFISTDKFRNYMTPYILKHGKFKSFTKKRSMDLSSFEIDFAKNKLMLIWNSKGKTSLEAYSCKNNLKRISLPKFKDVAQIYPGHTSRNGKYTTLSIIKEQHQRTTYIYDWRKRKIVQWVLPSSPEVDISKFVPISLEYYKANDGTHIPMLVRRPKQCINKTCPVIVKFHGGPEVQSRPRFSPYSQLFVDEGFVFVQPNVRGSRGYGKKWLQADDGIKRLDVIGDVKDCATHIKKYWSFDGVVPKIGVIGGSYGGYVAMFAMSKFAGSYDAGVANVGMSNLISFLNNTAPYRKKLRTTEYGDPKTDSEFLKKLSPITYVDSIKDPLLIIQGLNDPRVPAGEAIQMKNILDKKNIASELIIFPDEGHGVRKRKNQVLSVGHTLRFLKKHLMGTKDNGSKK